MSQDRIKVFVGTAPDGADAESQMVLEYTLRKYASMPVDIVWMTMTNDPESFWSGWNTKLWSTPFSGFRWAIPEYCGFEGQAIYMDSDMIINTDIAELWNNPFEAGKVVQSKGGWRFCVCKWDCAAAKPHLLPVSRMRTIAESHQRMMNSFAQNPNIIQMFDRQWNNFDGENDSLTSAKILHYTAMDHQPHLKYAIPRLKEEGKTHWFDGEVKTHWRQDVIELFDTQYREALRSGMTVEEYVPKEVIGTYSKLSQAGYKANHGYDPN